MPNSVHLSLRDGFMRCKDTKNTMKSIMCQIKCGSNIEYNPKFLSKIKKGTGISVPISFFLFPLAQAILMIAFHIRLSRGCLFIIYFRYRGNVILFNTDRYLLNNDKKRVK